MIKTLKKAIDWYSANPASMSVMTPSGMIPQRGEKL